MPSIHPTAIIDPSAKIADDVVIGPYCIIENDVEIGSGTRLIANCFIGRNTTLGSGNKVYPFASLGGDPQDYAYDGAVTYTKIGNNNIFREGSTVNKATGEGNETVIGNGCFLMANAHVGHNCKVGNNVILVAGCVLGGHCRIGDNALISGLSAVHQFCRVGRMAVLSGVSAISVDLPPFMIGDGRNGGVRSFNIVGLRRNGFSPETIRTIKKVYDIFFRQGLSTKNAIEKVEAEVEMLPEVTEFLDFVKSSKRGILTGDRHGRRS